MTTPVAVPDPSLPLADPTDPDTFSRRKLEHLRWEREDLAPGVLALAEASLDNANDALDASTDAATASAAATAAAAVAAAAANFKGTYASRVGAAAVPYSVSHLGKLWMLLSNLADVTTKVPGTDAEWQAIGSNPWIRKTTTYTALSGDRVKASTTGGAWSLTFPAAPTDGDEIELIDINGTFGSNNLTLLTNGKKIMGFTTSWVLDTSYVHLVFVYDSTLGDWRI